MEPTTEVTTQTAFRLPTSLIDRIDVYAQRLRKKAPGARVSRTDVVRVLLTRALDDAERAR